MHEGIYTGVQKHNISWTRKTGGYSEMYLEPSRTSTMKLICGFVGGLRTTFAKTSTLDVWQDSEYASVLKNV